MSKKDKTQREVAEWRRFESAIDKLLKSPPQPKKLKAVKKKPAK